MTDTFMKNAERAARLMEPHVAGLTEGKTAYEKAHSLFSIVELVGRSFEMPCETCKGGTARGNVNDGGDCSDCLNTRVEHATRFDELFTMHLAGDREGFDALLNEVLGV